MNPTDQADHDRRLDEVATAYVKEIERGNVPNAAEWLARYPDLADELAAFFAAQSQVAQLAAPLRLAAPVPDAATQGPASAPQRLGTVRYFGDYELLEEIARGGMGVVYKARQTKLDRIVAVKMILAGELAGQADVERFYTEARAAANLHHPNIVPIHEVGQHEGQHYFSMDYVAGESLANRIARGPLPAREAATLLVKVARAVAFAHVEGVIHRDLKPANILLDAQGEPHVTDFGLAKRVQGEPGASATGGLTETGQVLGTASYMPPEQAAGRTKDIGPRSDVYSLGAVLYCALTGRPPFQAASTLDTLMQVLEREPVSPRALNPAVSRDLETICLKCLDKDPRRRYRSAQELADELQRTLDGKPILARPISAPGRAWRWCRRNPVVAGMSAALVLAITAGMVTSILFAMKVRQEAIVSADLAIKADQLAIKEKEAAGKATKAAIEAQQAAENATKAADKATQQEALTRRHLYSAHMNLAHEALNRSNLLRAVELLNQHRPRPDHEDLRSFDWRYLWRECNRQQKTIPLTSGVKNTGYGNGLGGVWVHEFSVSPNGQYVAVGLQGMVLASHVRLMDITTGTLRKTIAAEANTKSGFANTWRQAFGQLLFSPDSKRFALVTWQLPETGSSIPHSPRLSVWDMDTMTERHVIPLPKFDEDDRIALSNTSVAAGYCERDKLFSTIKVWDLPKDAKQPIGPARVLPRREQARAQKPGAHRNRARFSYFTFTPDGKELAWGNSDLPGLVFTSLSGDGRQRSLPILSRYHELYDLLALSPDGKYVAYSASGPVVKLLDAQTGAEIHAFPAGHMNRSEDDLSRETGTICFSPDSRILAFGRRLSVALWDVPSKKQLGEVRWPLGPVRAIGFGADSRTLITASFDNAARVWDVHTRPGPEAIALGKGPRRKPRNWPDERQFEHDLVAGLGISPDGKTLATVWSCQRTASDSRAAFLYELSSDSLKQLAELPCDKPKDFEPSAIAFSRDGKWLALSGRGRTKDQGDHEHIHLCKISRGQKTQAALERTFVAPLSGSQRGPLVAVFSPDGTKFAYVACEYTIDWKANTDSRSSDRVHLYDLAVGTTRQFPKDPKSRFLGAPYWLFHWDHREGYCGGVVFSSDGKRLFTQYSWGGGNGCWIMAWDTATGTMLALLYTRAEPGQAAQTLALSPDDRTLASCHRDTIRLWDVSELALKEVMKKVKEQDDDVRTGKSKTASVLATPRAILRGHGDIITAIAFHPDGKILASASNDGTIKLWDVATGEVRLTLEGQATGLIMTGNTLTRVAALAFTPDGNALMYGTSSGTLKVWRGAAAPARDGP
jgi:WD40 repeat protein/tRNA A-37 threonylcarbamoyl transferase component Bud32